MITEESRDSRLRRGTFYGLGAYGLWGLFPAFWPLVGRAGSLELLAHRVFWSFLVSVLLWLIMVPRGSLRPMLDGRKLLLLAAAAAVISVNWGVFIWAATHGHVVETALGYYINPILSILFGVVLLSERLAPIQWVCVGLAAVAVIVLGFDYGRPPWVALVLAVSFAVYGLLKKKINAGAVETLTIESAYLVPIALGYLIFLQVTGGLTFGHLGWGHTLLLVASGPITALPLLLFAAAATRVPLSTLGLLQYLAPTLQFLLGVTYFGELMSVGRWIGFGLVWLALMLLTTYGLLRARRRRRDLLAARPTTGGATPRR
ncbi:EamA family transporter RarD [Microlunatus parietis]|uniref:Chloramphenicol-sensitive protein RarD n=1 Tax=Microlunatus parietis TaxID=682979 RepID=A0A7Y9LCW8_9ACTN|nr:EamA family transporter RarD [Microlunatus parietis]NYE71356.1 chloramphenicol-sensitive protein RarD [Microlunatus parietis]